MSATPSALPQAARVKLEALQAAAATPPADGTTPPGDGTTPPATTPPADGQPPAQGERVTISREEFNALQAGAARADTANARAADAQARNEELAHRLTQLESQGNAPNNGATPPAATPPAAKPGKLAAPSADGINFTDEENEQYGEGRSYIERVARLVVVEELVRLLPQIESQLEETRTTATSAAQSLNRVQANSFNAEVLKATPDIQTLIKHPQWQAYLDEVEPFSRKTMQVLLEHHVVNKDVDGMKQVYDAFRTKYVKPLPGSTGWESGAPDGGATPPPDDSKKQDKLKLSDRTKASLDFRHGKITWAQLQEVNTKFDEADKKGLVDYNA